MSLRCELCGELANATGNDCLAFRQRSRSVEPVELYGRSPWLGIRLVHKDCVQTLAKVLQEETDREEVQCSRCLLRFPKIRTYQILGQTVCLDCAEGKEASTFLSPR